MAAGHPLHADSTELRRQADRIVGIAQLPVIHAPWQLASWDRVKWRVNYSMPTLAAAVGLAVLVATLGFVVARQQKQALAAAAQRVSFVNRASHELRSPLTNMLLNLDLAAEAVEELPAEASRRLGLAQEEARRLGRLIENVLTFSQQERDRTESRCVACIPASVIHAVTEQFAPSFARRSLTVEQPHTVTCACLLDADALAQILANLLSNVEKYVPGGRITIEADVLTIRVSDEGPGIPEWENERVFRPFERLHSGVNEGASGTGLGLSIARDLACRMGGSLRLVPAATGASFELRVPAPVAAAPIAVQVA